MKLEVPFYQQTKPYNCGPAALRMVLAYLGKDYGIDFLEQKTGILDGKGSFTVQLAIAAALLGHPVHFFSTQLLFDERHMELDFYKRYSTMNTERSKQLLVEAQKAGVSTAEKTLTLVDLLSTITEHSIPIVILDWNVILGKKELGYRGHFVPIVGYDDVYVYIHQHGLTNPQAFMPIEKRLFDEARKARGTDEDIVIISRKN